MSGAGAAAAGVVDRKGYEEHRPLLFAALKKLADQGFVAPFDEGLDLIHEFFLEAWPGLIERFDPSKGKLRTYVFGAFVRFARPRIVRLARWRNSGTEEIGTLEDAGVMDGEEGIDALRLASAFVQLPVAERQLLEARLDDGVSERQLAARLGTTRHKIREQSAEALAKIVAVLGDSSLLGPRDLELVDALWGEGLRAEEAASALGLSTGRVRRQRQEILKALQRAFPTSHKGEVSQGKERIVNTLCEVWAALCSRPGAEALDRAKARAEELRGHLDDCVVCSEVVPTTEEGVRAAYEALAGDAAELTDPAAERLLELRSDVDKQVDEAVRKVLLPRLETSQLRKRGRQFDSLELFSAIDGVSLLLERETSDLHDRRATLSPRGLEVADRTIPVKLVIGEIRIMAEVEDARARELFDWLLDAAREVPELFPGAVVSTVPRNSKEVELCVSDRPAPLDLGRQWANRYARSRLSSNPAPAGWGQG